MDADAEDEFREFVVTRTPALLGTAYALTGDRGLAVLAWRPDLPGKPVAVFAVGGVRAEAVLANGDVTRFELSGGGGVLESAAAVRRVRVYGEGDRLIGEQVPGGGLVDVPREAPL